MASREWKEDELDAELRKKIREHLDIVRDLLAKAEIEVVLLKDGQTFKGRTR